MIGLPHPKWSERPLLVVVPAPGHDPSKDAILTHLKASPARAPACTACPRSCTWQLHAPSSAFMCNTTVQRRFPCGLCSWVMCRAK